MRTLLCVTVVASMSHAGEVLVTTNGGDGADAHVCACSPAFNLGLEPEIRLKNHPGCGQGQTVFNRKAYLRFDLDASGLSGPVQSATLNLIVTHPSQPADAPPPPAGTQTFLVFGLIDDDPADAPPALGGWQETAITWNNAPANDESPAGFDAAAVQLGSFTVDGIGLIGAPTPFTSPTLIDFINADTNGLVTLLVSRATSLSGCSTWVHGFASRESAIFDPPTLVLVAGGCSVADIAEPFGVLNNTDINAFVTAFLSMEPAADLNGDGNFNNSDINQFVQAFLAGCG